MVEIENPTHNLPSFHLQLPLPAEDFVAHGSLDAVARHDHLENSKKKKGKINNSMAQI